MAQVIKEIQLEVSKPNFIQAIVAKQFDSKSRWLRVQLVDNGEKITVADTSAVTINARRSDGGEKKFAGSVDKGKGTVLVPLSAWMLQLEGTVKSDVSVTDTSGRILTTTNFTIEVERASCQDSGVSEDDANIDILTQLILDVQSIKPDTTYNPESTNAQSGKAVAQALTQVKINVDNIVNAGSTNSVSGGAVYSELEKKADSQYVDEKIMPLDLSVEQLSDILDKSINLYNVNTNKVGTNINSSGVEVSITNMSATDYIYLLAGTYYVAGFSSLAGGTVQQFGYLSRYDINKKFKGRTEFNSGSFTMDYDGFVRFSGNTFNMQYIVLSKDTVPTEYAPFKIEIKASYFPVDQSYDSTSTKALSGIAVADALTQVKIDVDETVEENSTNPVSSGAVYKALQSVDVVTDNEMSNTSKNPVQNKVAKAYVDGKEDLTLKDSTDEKISFSIENGKLIATIKQDTEDTGDIEDTEGALDVVAYEGKTYRDIFVTNNLFPCGGFENGIDGVTVKGTPEVVSDVSHTGSKSLKCFASSTTAPYLKSTHYAAEGTFYAACYCRVDRRVSGVLGIRIAPSSGTATTSSFSARTDGFEKLSTINTFSSSTLGFFVGSFVGSTVDIDGYIDDVVLVDLSMFSTMPDQSTMDALYDEYINILTGKTPDVPSGDPNRFVISNEDGTSIKVADKVEDGNTNPVSSDAVYDALQQFKNDDTSFDYTKYNLPILYLNGDVSTISKDNEVTLEYLYGDKKGTCTLKWQGSSSLNYPKKNYTIKFDNKFVAKDGWGSQKKYCLKANYIDFSHARNVVSAKLWGQVVKSRTNVSERLSALPNAGAVDGFPVLVVINEKYQGLYTFNIPKDKWMFGITDGENSLVLPVDGYSQATGFTALETSLTDDDGKGFEIEYSPDTLTESDVLNRLNNFIGAVMNSTKENFETNVGEYCDLDSFIDYACFQCLITGLDNESKNYILTSYDMGKWFITAYDMDSTYGMYWNGTKYATLKNRPTFSNFENNLVNKIIRFMPDRVKERYAELRAGVMSEDNVQYEFYNFLAGIPKAIKDEECKLWSLIPNTDTNNVNQIVNQYILRCKYIDEQASKL